MQIKMATLPESIVFFTLEKAIDTRHHAMQRFYDIVGADLDKAQNIEMLERLKNGTSSREDEEAALDLIHAPY